jgi:hypothetical protein
VNRHADRFDRKIEETNEPPFKHGFFTGSKSQRENLVCTFRCSTTCSSICDYVISGRRPVNSKQTKTAFSTGSDHNIDHNRFVPRFERRKRIPCTMSLPARFRNIYFLRITLSDSPAIHSKMVNIIRVTSYGEGNGGHGNPLGKSEDTIMNRFKG